MMQHLKGQIQMHLFIFGYRWEYVAGFIGLILGILSAIIETPASILGFSIAFITTFLGSIVFRRDSKKLRFEEIDRYIVNTDPILLGSLKKSDRYNEYTFINYSKHYALYCYEVNRVLLDSILQIELVPNKFQIDSFVKSIAPFILRTSFKSCAVLFNSSKVRLKSDMTVNNIKSGCKFLLQKTDYFSSLCTNEMTCKEVWLRTSKSRLFDGLSFMSNNGIILDLQESKCSNHIGVSTIAFTSDGKMVITIQSAESAQSANLLAPSGSGSADFNDLKQQPKTLQTFITNAMERELLEECGLADNVDELVRTHLIGFARLLNRGGKPEFFGISFINKPFNSLKITNKEAVFIADIMPIRVNRGSIPEFKNALKRFRSERLNAFSFLLYLNIRFLEDYLDSSPNLFLELIGAKDL